ncbi:MAG: flagellin [Piscirickettsiaceae bacterium]|jgi:flagellin|nr:flagellin [Piscirickettsiaceae bacterium]
MSLTINTNPAAIRASFNLTENNKQLQQSLTRLSSGKRITKPADDAGGLAVSMKLTSSISRTKAAISNIQNSLSFGEVQDGALQAGARIVDRLAELKALSLDVMKSEADISNYNTEFRALQQQLFAITAETFNGVSLFASTTTTGTAMTFGNAATGKHTISVFTSDRGAAGSVVSLNKSALMSALTFTSLTDATQAATGSGITIAAADSGSAIDIGDISVSFFTTALENIATLRAENGATMTRLQFAEDHLRLSSANLEAANSRIMDVDVATESTALAKYNILSQASAAMLAQANSSQNTALMLLG